MMWSLSGFAIGIGLGFVVHRGDFCMHSALRGAVCGRVDPSLPAYLLALAVQLAGVNALAGAGRITVALPPVELGGAVVGGLMFGIGMVLAKG
jgi:uncharacterized membrane protein YedE/YeeE